MGGKATVNQHISGLPKQLEPVVTFQATKGQHASCVNAP